MDPNPPSDISVIVPAAGEGARLGGAVRKPFVELAGEPLLLRTCRRLARAPGVFEIVVALHPDDVDLFQAEKWEDARDAGIEIVVAGGASRAESVWNALQVVSAKAELVAVHDAARPFLSLDVFQALASVARKRGAAVPVVPLSDTVKRIEGDLVTETPIRTGLMRVRTPQVFRSDLLIEAFEYALRTGGLSEGVTDDATLVERMGEEVAAVYGSEFNIKITTPADMKLARVMLAGGLVE